MGKKDFHAVYNQTTGARAYSNTFGGLSNWSHEEHLRFLEALDQFGPHTPHNMSSAGGKIWSTITDIVRTRSAKEVKIHANRYFVQLQSINSQKRRELQCFQAIDSRWTLEEDQLFEELLNLYSDCPYYPWDVIASKFQYKTTKEVRERYLKLMYDIGYIEAGQSIAMNLRATPDTSSAAFHKRSKCASIPLILGIFPDKKRAEPEDMYAIYDCSVVLTSTEEELLMKALEESKVPESTSTETLAAVSAAIVALASKSNRKPPMRSEPVFTRQSAKTAIQTILHRQHVETGEALTLLLEKLGLMHANGQNDDNKNSKFSDSSHALIPKDFFESKMHLKQTAISKEGTADAMPVPKEYLSQPPPNSPSTSLPSTNQYCL